MITLGESVFPCKCAGKWGEQPSRKTPEKGNDSSQSCAWRLALSSHRGFRVVVFNLWAELGRNVPFMSQVWPQWEINGNFGSHNMVTAQCWYYPTGGQKKPVGTCGNPKVTARRSCLGSVKAPSDHTAQCSAFLGHTGRQKVSPAPQCPKLRHSQWHPGTWHSAVSLLWAQQGQLGHVPLGTLSPDCWNRAVRVSRTLEQSRHSQG